MRPALKCVICEADPPIAGHRENHPCATEVFCLGCSITFRFASFLAFVNMITTLIIATKSLDDCNHPDPILSQLDPPLGVLP
jgi:hypothetical protein